MRCLSMKKTVLVTGSSRGIGRAVALKFASCGYHVVINCARSTERMEEVKKEVVNMKCNHSKEQNEVLLENIVAFIEAHYEGGQDHE